MMGTKVKLSSDMMKSYDGTGDIVAWLKKTKLVAKLMEIKDLASFMPLYLEGDALALYLEMSETDQLDAGKIEDRLKEAFAQGRFEAYGRLIGLKWTGEQVDVYANEIRRLAGLAGWKAEGLELSVKLAFITGFPDRMSIELKQVKDFEKVSMADLITKARVLVSGETKDKEIAAVAVKGSNAEPRRQAITGGYSKGRGGMAPLARGFRGQCYRCGGPHMVRECKEPRPPITCFRCGKEGHISSRCNQGNLEWGAAAPEVTPLDK